MTTKPSHSNGVSSSVGGILCLDKPDGMTSRQAVDLVQRLSRPARAGHAGTLDPLATGVLVVCIGTATRLIQYVQKMRKSYVGTFLLGRSSPTEDIEGEITELANAPIPSRESIEAAASRFVGQIEQRPPVFSALKIQGRPAYELARKGNSVEMKPRPVEIHRIAVVEYDYPKLVLEVDCGGGTYIRSLGRDLAESLGTAAVMSALRRTAVGGFHVELAVDPRKLTQESWTRFLLPSIRALEGIPSAMLSLDDAARIRNGLSIELNSLAGSREKGDSPRPTFGRCPTERPEGCFAQMGTAPFFPSEIVAVDPDGEIIGILGRMADGRWRTLRNMPTGACK